MKLHTCTGPECFTCRIKTVNLRPTTAFQPHYNYAVGARVDTELEFRDQLKRRAEENSIATGTDHNYEMRDPSEMAQMTPFPDHDDIINTQTRNIVDAYK